MHTTRATSGFLHKTYDGHRLVIKGFNVNPDKMHPVFRLLADPRVNRHLVWFIDMTPNQQNPLNLNMELNIRLTGLIGGTVVSIDEDWLKEVKSVCKEG